MRLFRKKILSMVFVCAFTSTLSNSAVGEPLAALHPWPDTTRSRLAALALLQSLNAELLSNPSATLTLDRWCAAHNLAQAGTKITALLAKGSEKPADPSVRKLLGVGTDETIAYRRVRLSCGDRVLSEADNWYLPAKLTTEMNQALDTTTIAFGRAVAALNFTRSNLSAELLWSPLPTGWEMGVELPPPRSGTLALPDFVLRHRAVLKLPNGSPFSTVVENYTANVLDFSPPRID
jgi:hypothetical protein